MKDLLKLWSFHSNEFLISDLAVELDLSPKQTTRKLKQYEEKGWLTYVPGKGRGNRSTLSWNKNIEEILNEKIATLNLKGKLQKQIALENLPESAVSLLISLLLLPDNMGTPILKIPIYNKEIELNSLDQLDTERAWILSTVYSKLVDEDGDGDLAYYWETRGEYHLFFIRPNVYWHNGERMTITQIIRSLQKTFQYKKFDKFARKLKEIKGFEKGIAIHYDGSLKELLNLFGQIEFSIQFQSQSSGAFIFNKITEGQYKLTMNRNYYLTKPIMSEIILQTIPSQLIRKLSLDNMRTFNLVEKLEYAGTFYLYYNNLSPSFKEQEVLDFFSFFAKKVSELDPTKQNVRPDIKGNISITQPLKVGYVVNKNKFFSLLNSLVDETIQVDHLHTLDLKNPKELSSYDCLIVPMFDNESYQISEIFESTFQCKIPLYDSYRLMYYPKEFIRRGTDSFGYPNLKESFLSDSN